MDRFNSLDFIMDYESGNLSEDEVIEGFQNLINSGLVWQLQGCYGRMANALLESGQCSLPVNKKSYDYYGNEIKK